MSNSVFNQTEDGELNEDWEDYITRDDEDDIVTEDDETGGMATVTDITESSLLDDDIADDLAMLRLRRVKKLLANLTIRKLM